MNPIFRCKTNYTCDKDSLKSPEQCLLEIFQEFPKILDDISQILHIYRCITDNINCVCSEVSTINKIISVVNPQLILKEDDIKHKNRKNAKSCLCTGAEYDNILFCQIHRKPIPDCDSKEIINRYTTWETEYQPRMALQEFLYKQYSKTQRPLSEEKDKEMMEIRLKAWVNAHASDIVKRTIQQHNFMGDNKYMTSIRLSGTSMSGFEFEMPYQQAQKSSREEICELLRQKLAEKIKGLEKLEKEIKEAKLHIHSASEEVIYVCCGCEIRS